MARAVRYPLVTELFQGDPDVREQVIANPELKPEEVLAGSIMFERFFEDNGIARLSFFRHKEEDVIFSQRALLPDARTLSTFVNIDEVLIQGVEFAFKKRGWLAPKLEINFNVNYNDARIKKNSVDPSIEGNNLPRVPDWRLNMLNTWHFSEQTRASVGLRYGSSAFSGLENTATNKNTFEGISDYFVVNVKASHTLDNGLMLSAGIDNVNDEKYWWFHPFPQRTVVLDAVWEF